MLFRHPFLIGRRPRLEYHVRLICLRNRILNTILPIALTTTTMALNAAPIANYDSAGAGIKDLNARAKLQSFAIITKRSKKDKQTPATVRKLWLICDRGRHYIPDPSSRRTASMKTDCPSEATRTAFLIAIFCIGKYTEALLPRDRKSVV